MATRFYFGTAVSADTAYYPQSTWTTPVTAANRLSTTKDGSALADRTLSETASTAVNLQVGAFISAPLAAQTVSGTVSAVVRALESSTTSDAFLQIVVALVDCFGGNRRVLYAGSTSTTVSTTAGAQTQEFNTSAATRIWSAIALTSQTAVEGDRLTVEVGSRLVNTSTASLSSTVRLGAPSGSTDFALTAGLTTDLAPWVQLSQDLTFSTAVQPIWSDAFAGTDAVALPSSEYATAGSGAGSSVVYSSGSARFQTGTTSGSRRAARSIVRTNNVADLDVQFDVRFDTTAQPFDLQFYVRSTSTTLNTYDGYYVAVTAAGGTPGTVRYGVVRTATPYSGTDFGSVTAPVSPVGSTAWLRVRFAMVGRVMGLKTWNPANTEPDLWDRIYTDNDSGALLSGGTNGFTEDSSAASANSYVENLFIRPGVTPQNGTDYTRAITDSAGLVDTATQTEVYARSFTDGAGLVDTATQVEAYWRDFTDTTGSVDTATQVEAYARPFDDSATVTDTVTVGITYGRDFTDTAAVTDQAGTAAGFLRTADDPAGPTDTITSTAVPPLTAGATDTATVTDTPPTFIYGYGRPFTDAAGLTDSISLTVVPPLTAGAVDTTGVTDTVSTFKTSAYVLNVTDTAAGTDLLTSTRSSANSVTVDDAAPISDSVATVIIPSAIAFTDQAGPTDTVTTRLVQTVLNVTDTVGLTDTVATRVAQTSLPLSPDTMGVTDQVAFAITFTRAPTDTAAVTDTIGLVLARNIVIVDGITLTDSPTSPNYARRKITPADTVTLRDTATAVRTGYVTVTDSAGLVDPANAVKFLVPITGGTVLLTGGREAVAVLLTSPAAVAPLTPNRAVASATLVSTRAAVAALAAAQAGTANVEETYQ